MIAIIFTPFGLAIRMRNKVYGRVSQYSVERLMRVLRHRNPTITTLRVGDCKAYRINF